MMKICINKQKIKCTRIDHYMLCPLLSPGLWVLWLCTWDRYSSLMRRQTPAREIFPQYSTLPQNSQCTKDYSCKPLLKPITFAFWLRSSNLIWQCDVCIRHTELIRYCIGRDNNIEALRHLTHCFAPTFVRLPSRIQKSHTVYCSPINKITHGVNWGVN